MALGVLWAAPALPSEPPAVQAAFVLLGQSSEDGTMVPMVRVVVDGAGSACPSLAAADGSSTGAPRLTPRLNPDPVHFPITVCEARYPVGESFTVAGSMFLLPTVASEMTDLVVLGDTGCKPSDQTCEPGSENWPFAGLVSAAAAEPPDAVLHMGDYNYRGTPGSIAIEGLPDKVAIYDAGDHAPQGLCQATTAYYGQNSPGSELPDSWAAWQADFFEPAKPLLAAAPWVFTRGNHELCSRAGTGWFYLLDPSSTLLGGYTEQLSCPPATSPQPLVLSAPYLVDLGPIHLVSLDSANACDSGLLHADLYLNQFSVIESLVAAAGDADFVWLQTHRPFWGVDELDTLGACGPASSPEYCYLNQTLQYARTHAPAVSALGLVLSGHMHRFQAVAFPAGHPQQLVVGNGGVAMAGTHPKHTTQLEIDGVEATVMGTSEFGYLRLAVGDGAWTGTLYSTTGGTLASCGSGQVPFCALAE